MSPVVREDGSGSNTYNIEAISSSDSDSTDSENSGEHPINSTVSPPQRSHVSLDATNNEDDDMDGFSDLEGLLENNSSSSSSSSSSSNHSMNNDEPLAGFSPNLEPVNASWNSSNSSSSSNSNSEAAVIQTDDQDTI